MLNFKRITSGIEIESAPLPQEGKTIPHRIAVLGMAGADYKAPLDVPIEVVDSFEASTTFGRGSQLARMCKGLDGVAGQIVCFALSEPTGAGAKEKKVVLTKKNGNNTPTKDGKIQIHCNEETVVIHYQKSQSLESLFKEVEDSITSRPYLPFTAKASNGDNVTITSKWKGDLAKDIKMEVGVDTTEFTVTDTGASGGLPNVTKVYESFKNTWYTMAVLPFSDKTTLEKICKHSELRTDPLLHKPILNVCACVKAYADTKKLVEELDSRSMMVVCASDSPTMPGEIASDEVFKRIQCSQEQPNLSGRNIALRYTIPPEEILSPAQKEALVKAGGATIDSHGGNVYVDNETTTSKTVGGRENEIWRWSSTVILDLAKVHSLNLLFTAPPFDDYLIVNDEAKCSSLKALKPSTVKGYLSMLMTKWVADAWSKNLPAMLASIRVTIPEGNPYAYFVEYCDDYSVAGKRIFVRYSPVITSKV